VDFAAGETQVAGLASSIWLDRFIDLQAHVLNAFATAVSNDNIPIARARQQLNFRLA
jgi:hypothetical protein